MHDVRSITLLPALAAAILLQSVGASAQTLDNRSGEAHERVWFVPKLVGALSLEGGLAKPIVPSNGSGYPSTWFAGAGWKHYFEPHGRLHLRLMLDYEHGGVLNPRVEGTANRVGACAAFTLRGITQDWFFGQLTALVTGGLLWISAPPDPFTNDKPGFDRGFAIGFGLESTFGSMFMLDPYLMAETGANATLNYVDIGPIEMWELWGRWVVRFDLGVR